MKVVKRVVLLFSAVLIVILLFTGTVFAVSEQTGTITGSVVNFRALPNTSAKILDQLIRGTKVTVVGTEDNWCKVTYNDNTGWVSGDYITVTEKAISSGTVTGSVVNIRSKANINSAILTKARQGNTFDIFEESGDWYRISISQDRYGWINKNYFSPAGQDQSQSESQSASRGQTDTAVVEKQEPAEEASDSSNDLRQQIVTYSKKFLGTKYVYGGSTPKGFDCSGFVKYVFDNFNIKLARSSRNMGSSGTAIKKADLKPGDLVFFDTNGGLNGINHVGIYIGGGKFIHASSNLGRKVTISSLNDNFYSKTYMRARRYVKD